jgi:hypothetical protein
MIFCLCEVFIGRHMKQLHGRMNSYAERKSIYLIDLIIPQEFRHDGILDDP